MWAGQLAISKWQLARARVHDERLSRIEGVGKSSSIGFDVLQAHGQLPKTGDVWDDEPNPPM
jgi:hypothetical protein